jgi:hypothetical protein
MWISDRPSQKQTGGISSLKPRRGCEEFAAFSKSFLRKPQRRGRWRLQLKGIRSEWGGKEDGRAAKLEHEYWYNTSGPRHLACEKVYNRVCKLLLKGAVVLIYRRQNINLKIYRSVNLALSQNNLLRST